MKGCCLVILLSYVALTWMRSADAQLSSTFYGSSCPNVDSIVRAAMVTAMNRSQVVGPSVLRLFAHDCFVQGCDASILLLSTPTNSAERDASDNQSLQQAAFDSIGEVKQVVESQCPGVVSCADLVVMASRDAVNLMGGPSWSVQLGRRDSLVSLVSSVAGRLPGSDMDVIQLTAIFAAINLNQADMVVLSGAHTVGFSHCKEFADRLYNFNNVSNSTDPSLNSIYAQSLKNTCPDGSFSSSSVEPLDLLSAQVFDNFYYQDLQVGKGLLASDQTIFVDNNTNNLVVTYANNQPQFFNDFVNAMVAMSMAGVLTGSQGEIRLNCSVVNSASPTIPPPASNPPPSTPTVTPPTVPSPPPPAPPTLTPSPTVSAPTPPIVTPSSPPPPTFTASPPPSPTFSSPPPPAPTFTNPSPPTPGG